MLNAAPWHDALTVSGRLGALEVGRLRRAMQRVVLSGSRDIDLDLRGVWHADYRALGPLFHTVAECERSGARLCVNYGSRYVQELFRLAYPGTGDSLLVSAPPSDAQPDEFDVRAQVNG
jgi:ABC-type transporter Mla MlaB component